MALSDIATRLNEAGANGAFVQDPQREVLIDTLNDQFGLLNVSDVDYTTSPIVKADRLTIGGKSSWLAARGDEASTVKGTLDSQEEGVKEISEIFTLTQADVEEWLQRPDADVWDLAGPQLYSRIGAGLASTIGGRYEGANVTSPFSRSIRTSVTNEVDLHDITEDDVIVRALEAARASLTGPRQASSSLQAVVGVDAEKYVNNSRRAVETSDRLYQSVQDLFPGHTIAQDQTLDTGLALATTAATVPDLNADAILGVVGPFATHSRVRITNDIEITFSTEGDAPGGYNAFSRRLILMRVYLRAGILLLDPSKFCKITSPDPTP